MPRCGSTGTRVEEGIRIEAPSALSATELARALCVFTRPRVERVGRGQWAVCIDDDSEATLNRAIGAVDRWLRASNLGATTLHFGGRAFRMTPPGGSESAREGLS